MNPLGKTPEILAKRDAVHIAITPVTISGFVSPGEKVVWADKSQNTVKKAEKEKPIGVIDPFLKYNLYPGSTAYLCLYPNEVTGMTHSWEHPEFEPESKTSEVENMGKIAAACGKTLEAIMDDMDVFTENGTVFDGWDYIRDDSERYKRLTREDWKLLWKYWAKINNYTLPENFDIYCPYTCSC